MEFRQIAQQLGIEKYPEQLDEIYSSGRYKEVDIFDEALMEYLQQTYESFGNYYNEVVAGARELKNDPIRTAYTQTVAVFVQEADIVPVKGVLWPEMNGTLAGDLMPLYALIPQIPKSVEDYLARGFSQQIAAKCARTYGGCIKSVYNLTGRPGINRLYYNWLCLYAKSVIFNVAGFNFELRKFPKTVMCLRNRQSGEVVILMEQATVHKNGMILGSAGFEDPEGSYDAKVRQTDDCFYGCPVEKCRVVNTIECYPKEQWECVLQPGDDVVSLHIPKGADLTPDNVRAALETGLSMARQCYPDYSVKALECTSWLLDPMIGELMGEESRIAGFGNMFLRYPVLCAGQSVFTFVFIGQYPDYASLPEDTRLQRVLKKLYMDGGYIHRFGGFIL